MQSMYFSFVFVFFSVSLSSRCCFTNFSLLWSIFCDGFLQHQGDSTTHSTSNKLCVDWLLLLLFAYSVSVSVRTDGVCVNGLVRILALYCIYPCTVYILLMLNLCVNIGTVYSGVRMIDDTTLTFREN